MTLQVFIKSGNFLLIVGPLIHSFDIFLLHMQVLTDTDHCYCVLLNALDGAAFPSEKETNDSSSSDKLPLRVDTNSMKTKTSKVWVISQVLYDNLCVSVP